MIAFIGVRNLVAHHREKLRLQPVRRLRRQPRLAHSSFVVRAFGNIAENKHRAAVRGWGAARLDCAAVAKTPHAAARLRVVELLDHPGDEIVRTVASEPALLGVNAHHVVEAGADAEEFLPQCVVPEDPVEIIVPGDELSLAVEGRDRPVDALQRHLQQRGLTCEIKLSLFEFGNIRANAYDAAIRGLLFLDAQPAPGIDYLLKPPGGVTMLGKSCLKPLFLPSLGGAVLSAHQPEPQQVFKPNARPDLVRGGRISLKICVVADDQSILGVEQRKAFRYSLDRIDEPSLGSLDLVDILIEPRGKTHEHRAEDADNARHREACRDVGRNSQIALPERVGLAHACGDHERQTLKSDELGQLGLAVLALRFQPSAGLLTRRPRDRIAPCVACQSQLDVD